MDFVTDQLKLLGLNEREVRVFTTLATFGRMNMTRLAGHSGLARTTVDYIVRCFVEQGLVSREKIGGHWEYTVPLKELTTKLDTLEQKLSPIVVSATNDENFVNSNGSDTHFKIEDAFRVHSGERVTLLLAAFIDKNERIIELEHYLSYARKNTAKLEVLTTRDVADNLSKYAEELLALLSCVELRINILPVSFCIQGVDLLTFRDETYTIDHHGNRLERSRGPLTVETTKHLLRIARETGWSVDIRMFLENRLVERAGKA